MAKYGKKATKRSKKNPGYYDVMSDHMIEDMRNKPPAMHKRQIMHESMQGDVAGVSKSKRMRKGI
jgi:hypothetical protein